MAHGQGATSNRKGGYGALSRGPRGHGKDKAVKRQERKERDQRIRSAQAATRQAQEDLDKVIAEQAENPAIGETPGAIYARRQAELELEAAQALELEAMREEVESGALDPKVPVVLGETPEPPRRLKSVPEPIQEVEVERAYVREIHRIDPKELPQTGDGKWKFSYQTARIMLKEGYNIKRVIKYTGIGYEDLADIPLDDEGYVIEEEDEDAEAGS